MPGFNLKRFCRFAELVFILSLLTNATAWQSNAQLPVLTFAVIGDYGMDNPEQAAVANLVDSWAPDLIITTGDDYYNPAGGSGSDRYDESTGAYFCAYLKNITTSGQRCQAPGGAQSVNRFFPSLGNHDYSDTGNATGLPAVYTDYFSLPGTGYTSSSGNERYYDFTAGPVHFFVLNSNPGAGQEPDGVDSASLQAQWLQTQLAASTAPWKIVYFHHPPYSSGPHGSNLWMQWPFAQWGADVVLSGHEHAYERILRDHMVYFVNGLGGANLYNFSSPVVGSAYRFNASWGAQRVTVEPGLLQFELYSSEGGGKLKEAFNVAQSQVLASAEDAEQRLSDGFVYLISTDLELVNDLQLGEQSEQLVGLRFSDLKIPANALIVDAYIEFRVDEKSSETTSLTFRGEATDNAAVFSSSAFDLSNRPTTSASASWTDLPAWSLLGERQRTPNLAPIIQEIVNRSGWAAGNSLAILIEGTGRRVAESSDKPGGVAPRLYVQFVTFPVFDWRLFLPTIHR